MTGLVTEVPLSRKVPAPVLTTPTETLQVTTCTLKRLMPILVVHH
jgi:hypothetical protein